MKTFHQFAEQARSVRVPLHPFYTIPSNNKGNTLKLLKKDITPICDDPLARKKKKKTDLVAKLIKDDKINSQYKDITNPKKPSELDLIKGATKKA